MPLLRIEGLVALAMLAALTFYAIMGGADYGGGVWDLFALGSRAQRQRDLIRKAIAPIWEANHVWLILAIVLLFTCFPPAFYAVCVSLHIPLTLMLFGIVLRGSAFVFRSYGSKRDHLQRLWSRVFAISSIITPILLGIVIGAISNGRITTTAGDFYSVFMAPWLQPFPITVGLLALSLFAYLAAVYLTADTMDKEIQEDFRLRALISFFVSALMAASVFIYSRVEAPEIWTDLSVAFPVHIVTAALSAASLICLVRRWFKAARFFAAGQVALILWGWAAAQYPYLVRPGITVESAAANARTLSLVIVSLIAGALLLFPSFYYLYKIFKLGDTEVVERNF